LSKQIAAKLGLSEITVKVCRASIMKKMGCATTVVTPNGTAWWRGGVCERLPVALLLQLIGVVN